MTIHHFHRPFPALTPNQRMHLDVYGYVVIEKVLTPAEVKRLTDKMYAIEEHHRTRGKPPEGVTSCSEASREYFRIDNLPHVDPAFFDYVTHPRLVGMAEEAVGGTVRLEQSDAHIRRAPENNSSQKYGFHRGAEAHFANTRGGLYHCHFVKTLTNLTDLGPDDGGTTVIAGSHKMLDIDQKAVIAAAGDDPRLIHQVAAPAGSTLLFFESLLHSGGIIHSDKDRLLIVAGYTPTMFQAWHGYDPVPGFVETVPEEFRDMLEGTQRYHQWTPRVRKLDEPVEKGWNGTPTKPA